MTGGGNEDPTRAVPQLAVVGAGPPRWRWLGPFCLFADLVKFEHTVFALPFAFVGCLLGASGHPTGTQVFWIIAAMVGARTAGMALNRLIDRHIDARNPRTCDRALPAGRISVAAVRTIVVVALGLLVLAASRLNALALALSPLAVVLLVLYSYLKRFTWLAHAGLGLVLACAPLGGWIAVRGNLDLPPILLALAVFLWSGGFDVLYGCQDVAFDHGEGLHSLPRRFGIARAMQVARAAHVASILLLTAVGVITGSGGWFFAGVTVAALLLVYEHHLISPQDLSRMNQAFFTMNGWVSISLLFFTWMDTHGFN